MVKDYSFEDIPQEWLYQELSVSSHILAKQSYYSNRKVQLTLEEFFNDQFIPPGGLDIQVALSRITEVLDKFNNLGLLRNFEYGYGQMQHTTAFFDVDTDKLRLYKVELLKEIGCKNDKQGFKENGDLLVNGKLSYSIDNREVKYGDNPSQPLEPTSDYGKLLVLLMSNIEHRVSYTEICDTLHINYETEKVNPENNSSIRRQVQQIKKDLLKRLEKAGVPKNVLENLIVPRDGYKMSRIN